MKSAHWPKWIALALKSLKVAEQRLRCHCHCHDHAHIPCPLCFARWPSVGAGGRQRETDDTSLDWSCNHCVWLCLHITATCRPCPDRTSDRIGRRLACHLSLSPPSVAVCLGGAGNACEICVNILFGFVKCSSLWQTLIASIFWPICQVLS